MTWDSCTAVTLTSSLPLRYIYIYIYIYIYRLSLHCFCTSKHVAHPDYWNKASQLFYLRQRVSNTCFYIKDWVCNPKCCILNLNTLSSTCDQVSNCSLNNRESVETWDPKNIHHHRWNSWQAVYMYIRNCVYYFYFYSILILNICIYLLSLCVAPPKPPKLSWLVSHIPINPAQMILHQFHYYVYFTELIKYTVGYKVLM